MSRANINDLMIWKEDDIQEETTFFAFTPLKYIQELNANLIYVNW